MTTEPGAGEPPLDLTSGKCRGGLVRRTGARRTLTVLRDCSGFTASLAALDGARAVYIYRVPGGQAHQREADMGFSAGDDIPLHCTAAGKALLCCLRQSEARRTIGSLTLTPYTPNTVTHKQALIRHVKSASWRGIATAESEFAAGVISLATPVIPSYSELTLAVELTIHSSYATMGYARLTERMHLVLLAAAAAISLRLRPGPLPIPIVPKDQRLTRAESRARAEDMARLRHVEKMSLTAIGQRYGVTRQRVEQILKAREHRLRLR